MLILADLCAVRMADDRSVDSDLPDCNCDVTRQAYLFFFLLCISFLSFSYPVGD